MKQIQCVGAGFDPSQSSCSNLKPKTFSWTTEPVDNQVLIDNAILYANKIDRLDSQKSYGWVCESLCKSNVRVIPLFCIIILLSRMSLHL